MENQNINCQKPTYRQLYDKFRSSSFFSGLDEYYMEPQTVSERNKLVDTGYRVNKTIEDLQNWRSYDRSSFNYKVFDHLRIIQETLAGIFTTDDDEFKLIFPEFIKEFIFSDVYVIYSEEIKVLELTLAEKLAIEANQDPYEWIERSCPNSNWRLFRRVRDNDNKPQWDAVLSGVQNIDIEGLTSISDGQPLPLPIRFTFNNGLMFPRVFNIFQTFEAQLQYYFNLFDTLHTVLVLNGENPSGIQKKLHEILSPATILTSLTTEMKDSTSAEKLELVSEMTNLTESYHNIQTLLNDSLAEIGFGGDDSTKCERITTGENFRALQPSMAFQQAILHALENVTYRIKLHFKKDIKFEKALMPNEQGVPEEQGNPEDKKKQNKDKKQW